MRDSFVDAHFIHEPDQDRTDFQKALDYALDRLDAKEVVVLGSEGDRLDHTLSSLGAAAGRAGDASIRFVFETSIVHLVAAGEVRLKTRRGALISILPVLPSKITSGAGLQWAVDGLELAFGVRDGVSNRAGGDEVRLHVASGCLVVFVERREGDVEW